MRVVFLRFAFPATAAFDAEPGWCACGRVRITCEMRCIILMCIMPKEW
nr:MAG TPA: hypothetical protein [Caudoviricetes sp.]